MQDCYNKGIPIDSDLRKSQAIIRHLKQKEGGGSKAGEFNVSKGWFDNFRKSFGLKYVITREAASAHQEAAHSSQMLLRKSLRKGWGEKIIQEKGYLPEELFNTDKKKCPILAKMPQSIFVSKEKK